MPGIGGKAVGSRAGTTPGPNSILSPSPNSGAVFGWSWRCRARSGPYASHCKVVDDRKARVRVLCGHSCDECRDSVEVVDHIDIAARLRLPAAAIGLDRITGDDREFGRAPSAGESGANRHREDSALEEVALLGKGLAGGFVDIPDPGKTGSSSNDDCDMARGDVACRLRCMSGGQGPAKQPSAIDPGLRGRGGQA